MSADELRSYVRTWPWVRYWPKYWEQIADAHSSLALVRELIDLRLLYPNFAVIDVGCGDGTMLQKTFAKRMVGIDYGASYYLESNNIEFIDQDLRVPYSKWYHKPKGFDLVLCLETAEHLPPESADTLIDTLVSVGDTILFSAATVGQGGFMHLNEQPPEYWEEKFNLRGYFKTSDTFDHLEIAEWYKHARIYKRR
jgi:SAM-dependent methyltransferase